MTADRVLTPEEMTFDDWYGWFTGMLNRKPNDAEKNAIYHLLEAQRGLIASTLQAEIADRLDSLCPNDGEEIYKCPRCVRQLRDELRGSSFKVKAEAERLDRPDREKIAKIIWLDGDKCETGTVTDLCWREMPAQLKEKWLKKADQIIALFPDVNKIWIEAFASVGVIIASSQEIPETIKYIRAWKEAEHQQVVGEIFGVVKKVAKDREKDGFGSQRGWLTDIEEALKARGKK